MSSSQDSVSAIDTSKSSNLKKVISSLPAEINKKQLAKHTRKIKKFRPLPSVNVMRNRVVTYLLSEREKLLSSVNKLKKNPYELNKTFEKIRTDNRTISDFKKKSLQDIKDYYFRLFWYKHWVKPEGGDEK